MWLIAGTVPQNNFSLYTASVSQAGDVADGCLLLPDGHNLPIARGTTALAATAILACKALGSPPPRLLLAGYHGQGDGSLAAYEWLAKHISRIAAQETLQGVTFHYFYPDVDGHNRLYASLDSLRPRPLLMADAGFMYVAKMSGYATGYDLFTPDMGELAFLADERAPHPFYTRGFLLDTAQGIPELIARARQHENCPPNLIVKGQTDYIICNGEIVAEINEPCVPAMECIGGTGDIVTGFATAFLAAGYPLCESCIAAAQAARFLASFCKPNPATQAAELISQIEPMLAKYGDQIFTTL